MIDHKAVHAATKRALDKFGGSERRDNVIKAAAALLERDPALVVKMQQDALIRGLGWVKGAFDEFLLGAKDVILRGQQPPTEVIIRVGVSRGTGGEAPQGPGPESAKQESNSGTV